jgi:hypothetical protein
MLSPRAQLGSRHVATYRDTVTPDEKDRALDIFTLAFVDDPMLR